MKFATRLLLVPVALALAVLSFAHAASETGRATFPPGFFGPLGIDSHIIGEVVDRAFKAEMTALQSEALAKQGEISAEDLASLAEDPVALQRFIEERERSGAPDSGDEYPRISAELLRLARLSYASDPLNALTLRTIALGHVQHEDPDRARRLMQLAARLSKRDTITNLWLAQDYGQRGNVEQMLNSFDHALRTSRSAREGAMGLVVGSLNSVESHKMLGDLLRQQPDWEDAFWIEFSRNPVAIANASAFFKNSGIPLQQIPEQRRPALYANLKRSGLYGALFELAGVDSAAGTGTGTGTQDSRAIGFDLADESNPLGWTFHSRGTFSTAVNRSTNELQIDARAGAFGLAADRVMRGGRDFEMALRMADPVPPSVGVTLSATCVDGQKRELANVALSPGDKDGTETVQARECDFMSLDLSFEVEQGRRNPLIRIASIDLRER